MRIISRRPLREFAARFPDAAGPLGDWYNLMRRRAYRSPHELKADFAKASFLGDGRAVLNIGGNRYRLVVHLRYDIGIVFVQKVLSHAEYDAHIAAGTL